ncbi:hypothetical protein D8770_27875 [Methylobacterium sp. DB1607]|nr:hypothetical protein [Methylobacterium sp. DB1607]
MQSLDDGIPIIQGRAGAPIAPVLAPSDPAQCTRWTAIGRLIDAITPDECANFFAAPGYEPD